MYYSISDLEQLSGVSTHKIRIWERRYKALMPDRSAGNTRLYNDEQLKRLLNIAGIHNAGYKISKACAMDKAEMETILQQEINLIIPANQRFEYYIIQIIKNGLEYQAEKVNSLIQNSFDSNGVLETYKFVLYPLLVRMGLMWRQETLCPSQEHFVSCIIRQKLFAAIDGCVCDENDQGKWLLFLPEDEDHDIGLLLANYLLRAAGIQLIYLGSKVPYQALSNTINVVNPDKLLFFMTRVRPTTDAQGFINRLAADFPRQTIHVSGNQKLLSNLELPVNVRWPQDITDLEKMIN